MKKMMVVAVSSILAFVVLLFIIGLFLPKQREYIKSTDFQSPVEKVFNIVTDFENQASWRSDVKEIKVIDGDSWTEISHRGPSISFKIRKKVPNQRFEIEIIHPEMFHGHWVGTFEPTAKGTKVIFKEVITIANPILRVMSAIFVDLDKTMEIYMTDLKSQLGE